MKNTPGLTVTQGAMLNAIAELTSEDVSPSYQELADRLGLKSKAQVSFLLHRLRERGRIQWEPGKARSIRLLDDNGQLSKLAAMSPDELSDLIEEAGRALAARAGVSEAKAVFAQIQAGLGM